MTKDYHMHPALLCSSEERFGLFVDQALRLGIQEICITDHMPLSFSSASDRIPMGKVEDYCRSVRTISDKYKDVISIKLGIEIDYHPSVVDEIEAVLKCGDFDYVLGSSHLHVMENGNIVKNASGRNEYARLMFENTISAARSGYFDAIAHLDMFKAVFANSKRYALPDDGYSDEKHLELIDRTLDVIKEKGLYLELNTHLVGFNDLDIEYTYPSATIVEMALQKGVRFSYGSDAHKPEQVGAYLGELKKHPTYKKALDIWESEN